MIKRHLSDAPSSRRAIKATKHERRDQSLVGLNISSETIAMINVVFY